MPIRHGLVRLEIQSFCVERKAAFFPAKGAPRLAPGLPASVVEGDTFSPEAGRSLERAPRLKVGVVGGR